MRTDITPKIITNYLAGIRDDVVARNADWVELFRTKPTRAAERIDQMIADTAKLEIIAKYIDIVEYGIGEQLTDDVIVGDIRTTLSRDLHWQTGKTGRATSLSATMLECARATEMAKFSEWLNGRH